MSPAVPALVTWGTFLAAVLDAGKTSGKLPFLSLSSDADLIQYDTAGCRRRGGGHPARFRLPAAGSSLLLRAIPARTFRRGAPPRYRGSARRAAEVASRIR